MNQQAKSGISRSTIIRISISVLAALLVAATLLVDLVTTGLSGGIGPLQIAVSIGGIFLMILPWLRLSALGSFLLILGSLALMIVGLEFALTFAGFMPEYRSPPDFDPNATVDLRVEPSRICDDERGCHWDPAIASQCDAQSRICRVNAYGLTSEVEFTAESIPDNVYRILVLGDSFTWGASADYGMGWVDHLQRLLNENQPTLIWNAAMPGTGTEQAIITARNLMPILQPDLVILGFHSGNDFADNLFPYDRFIHIYTPSGVSEVVQQYSFDSDGQPFRETDAVLYYRAQGYTVSSTRGWVAQLDQFLLNTRLGTLLVGAYRTLTWDSNNLPASEALLTELKTLVAASDTPLLVVIIPEQNDTVSATQKYRGAVTVMQRTAQTYVDTLPLLSFADFENTNPNDKHLNNEGHRIVGEYMATCLIAAIANNDFQCP